MPLFWANWMGIIANNKKALVNQLPIGSDSSLQLCQKTVFFSINRLAVWCVVWLGGGSNPKYLLPTT